MVEFYVLAGLLGLSMVLNAGLVGFMIWQQNRVAVDSEEVSEPVELVSSKERVSGFIAN